MKKILKADLQKHIRKIQLDAINGEKCPDDTTKKMVDLLWPLIQYLQDNNHGSGIDTNLLKQYEYNEHTYSIHSKSNKPEPELMLNNEFTPKIGEFCTVEFTDGEIKEDLIVELVKVVADDFHGLICQAPIRVKNSNFGDYVIFNLVGTFFHAQP